MAKILYGRTEKQYAEFVGTYVRPHRGIEMPLTGEEADHLCDGIAEIIQERDNLIEVCGDVADILRNTRMERMGEHGEELRLRIIKQLETGSKTLPSPYAD